MPEKNAAEVVESVELSDERAKELSERILELTAGAEAHKRTTVGQWVLVEVFEGSEAAFRSQSPTKERSLNKLVRQPGMKEAGWGRDTLDLSVELFLLSKTFESLNAWPHLLPSHYEQIFGLETEKQREWLDEAEKNRWTIRQLAEKLGKKWATTQPGDEPSKDAEPRSFKSELGLARNMVKRFADIQSGLLTLAVEAKLGLTTEELDQGARILIDLEFYLGYLQDKLDTKKG